MIPMNEIMCSLRKPISAKNKLDFRYLLRIFKIDKEMIWNLNFQLLWDVETEVYDIDSVT